MRCSIASFWYVSPRKARLADSDQEWCRQLGMLLPESGRQAPLGRACLDWTERRQRLGGALGVALFSRLNELRWIVKNPASRAVHVTHPGAIALEKQLGIRIPR